jgi:hypothetical protein
LGDAFYKFRETRKSREAELTISTIPKTKNGESVGIKGKEEINL